jgi:NAD(P)-dependent dehydrogenase (short-subunit alcohol dehydrogenase family)
LQADVTDAISVARLMERAVEELGTIDVLVHLVGGWVGGVPLHEHTPEMWDRAMDLNLRSAFLCACGVLPIMREQGWGRIVFVSSRSARSDRHLEGGYATAKAGVAVLAEVIAEENRDLDVTANVAAPSVLDTPANRKARPETEPDAMVSVEDAARVIAFLASSEAGQLRGAWLPVFGRV